MKKKDLLDQTLVMMGCSAQTIIHLATSTDPLKPDDPNRFDLVRNGHKTAQQRSIYPKPKDWRPKTHL